MYLNEGEQERDDGFGWFVPMDEIPAPSFKRGDCNSAQFQHAKTRLFSTRKKVDRLIEEELDEETEELYDFDALFSNQPLDYLGYFASKGDDKAGNGRGLFSFVSDAAESVGHVAKILKIPQVMNKLLPKPARIPAIITAINFLLIEKKKPAPMITRYGC